MNREQEYRRFQQRKSQNLAEELVNLVLDVVIVRPGTRLANRFIKLLDKFRK